uniref:Uncharacterized protein n=1 Tax=Rhizophora mucronata TaxID=61149 RepID=A0A2P2ITS9_RHIMU
MKTISDLTTSHHACYSSSSFLPS